MFTLLSRHKSQQTTFTGKIVSAYCIFWEIHHQYLILQSTNQDGDESKILSWQLGLSLLQKQRRVTIFHDSWQFLEGKKILSHASVKVFQEQRNKSNEDLFTHLPKWWLKGYKLFIRSNVNSILWYVAFGISIFILQINTVMFKLNQQISTSAAV